LKKFVLCADDYGLSDAVNHAILELILSGRLNAVSCMSVARALQMSAKPLLEACHKASNSVEIGLHLTFTEYVSLGPVSSISDAERKLPSINALLAKSHLGFLDKEAIAQETNRQIDQFELLFGRMPDFLDGHQHVHVLPVFRDVIAEIAADRLEKGSWVRNCHRPIGQVFQNNPSRLKSLVISAMAGTARKKLDLHGLETNDLFLGIHNFDVKRSFQTFMKMWLATVSKFEGKTLIMCHPGFESRSDAVEFHDPIAHHRSIEFAYLESDHFKRDLEEVGLTLT